MDSSPACKHSVLWQLGTTAQWRSVTGATRPCTPTHRHTDTPANGDINEDGTVDAGDVLLVTRFVMGLDTPTVDEMIRADVAPFYGSYPVPNGSIDAGDLVRIQRMALGL